MQASYGSGTRYTYMPKTYIFNSFKQEDFIKITDKWMCLKRLSPCCRRHILGSSPSQRFPCNKLERDTLCRKSFNISLAAAAGNYCLNPSCSFWPMGYQGTVLKVFNSLSEVSLPPAFQFSDRDTCRKGSLSLAHKSQWSLANLQFLLVKFEGSTVTIFLISLIHLAHSDRATSWCQALC